MDKYFEDGSGPRLLQTSDQEDFVRDEVTERLGMIWLGRKQQLLQPVPPACSGFTHFSIFLECVVGCTPRKRQNRGMDSDLMHMKARYTEASEF